MPGSQRAFVRKDGSLGFTVPHSGAILEGASTGPFQFTPQETDGTVGKLLFATRGFNACKTGEKGFSGQDAYQLYALAVGSEAQLEKACVDVGFGKLVLIPFLWPNCHHKSRVLICYSHCDMD